MKPQTVCTVVFSPTGTSKKIAAAIARGIASRAGAESAAETALQTVDLTHAAPQDAKLSADKIGRAHV